MRKVSLGKTIQATNEAIAQANRDAFRRNGIYVVNMIGSPGSGKTAILEHTARHFGGRFAAIIGDVKTALDADRLEACGARAHSIETGGGCHLNAAQIATAVASLPLKDMDFLFIENVGNLVCPSTFDLGEDVKAAVLSVPEGDEKVRKYPALFVRADVVFVNKTDLLAHCPYDVERVKADVNVLRPGARVFETCALKGEGFAPWFEFLWEARRDPSA